MSTYTIVTPYGDRYTIDEQWRISKRGVEPSGQWTLVALGRIGPFGHVTRVPKEAIANLADKQWQATFANGKPRYTVIDNDHGTRRIWGNTRVHGILHVYKSEQEAAHERKA